MTELATTPFTLWLYPYDEPEGREVERYENVIDAMRMPSGTIKFTTADGLQYERVGDIIRVRDEPDSN